MADADPDGQRIIDLVASAIDGDSEAWNDLVGRFAPLIVSILARYRIFGADAEDISQIVWLRLLEHLRELREPRALPLYIVRTTTNEAMRWFRATSKTRPFDPQLDVPEQLSEGAEQDDPVLRAERRSILLAALAELPAKQRDLLLLLLEDPPVPYQEISKRLGMPIGSIGPTRARALRELRDSPAIAALFDDDTNNQGGGRHDVATLGSR
jgi:RNA polymerase sigma factor (sigma-70 family)